MIWCPRKVGGGRAPRQPGQVRKEAAVTGSRPGRLSAFHPSRPGRSRPTAWPPTSSAPPSPTWAAPPRRKACRSRPRPRGRACSASPPPPRPPRRAPPPAARPPRRPARPTACWPANTARRIFDDLIGQDALVRTLRNAFAQGRVHHAFMLTGVRGVGKTTTARIIARALNCIGAGRQGRPDRRSLRRLPGMPRHPGRPPPRRARRWTPPRNNGVDDVRELREALRFRPAQGRHKVFILDEVPHAVGRRLQRAAEDAGGTAAARQLHAGDDRTAQGAGHHPLPLPDLLACAACRRTMLRDHFAGIAAQGSRRRSRPRRSA